MKKRLALLGLAILSFAVMTGAASALEITTFLQPVPQQDVVTVTGRCAAGATVAYVYDVPALPTKVNAVKVTVHPVEGAPDPCLGSKVALSGVGGIGALDATAQAYDPDGNVFDITGGRALGIFTPTTFSVTVFR